MRDERRMVSLQREQERLSCRISGQVSDVRNGLLTSGEYFPAWHIKTISIPPSPSEKEATGRYNAIVFEKQATRLTYALVITVKITHQQPKIKPCIAIIIIKGHLVVMAPEYVKLKL
jgi:hypothetical protein